MSRYVVTEIEGFWTPTARVSGSSFHVLDTAFNHRGVATFRSEDLRTRSYAHPGASATYPTPWEARQKTREIAQAKADELNAEDQLKRAA